MCDINVEIIALDATFKERAEQKTLTPLVKEIKKNHPKQKLMADISSLEELLLAEQLGFNDAGTTLVSYTEYTKGAVALDALSAILKKVTIPVIAEGDFDTPKKAKKALELGATSVVVGAAMTRLQPIAKKFVEAPGETFSQVEVILLSLKGEIVLTTPRTLALWND